MANRRFTSQFSYSFEREVVKLMGYFQQSGSTGTFATLTDHGITYTAVTMGTYGNTIFVALVTGGTAGAEVVTVTGKKISVQIQSGTSTRTQVKTALDASPAAAALISTSVSSGGTAATLLSSTALATGTDTVFTSTAQNGTFTISQTGTGVFTATFADSYPNLLGVNIMFQSSTAADLKPQMKSADPTTAQTAVFEALAVATPTNLSSGQGFYAEFTLRNSKNP